LSDIPESVLSSYFGEAYPKISQFGSLLVTDGITKGLIGPREADRIWERHLVNCAGVCSVLPTSGAILDLGSGAGLPGLIIAIMRPLQPVILLESLLRRTSWLSEMAATLALPNVTVVRGRAGENLQLPDVSAVTARAVAPLNKLLVWSAPILKPGGGLYALKGSNVADEIGALNSGPDTKKISKDWLLPPSVVQIETIVGVEPTTVAKVIKR